MTGKFLLYIFVLAVLSKTALLHADEINNSIDDTPVEDIKSDIVNDDSLKNLGGAISNFMESDGGKQLGSMLMNSMTAGGNNNVIMSQLLQGVGSLMQQNMGQSENSKGETAPSPGINPELMGSLLSMMVNQGKSGGGGSTDSGGLDMNTMLQMLMSVTDPNSSGGLLGLLPNLLSLFMKSFSGPEAKKKELEHADHSWMVPPIMEKMHIFLQNFLDSEMGEAFLESSGANKAMKVFSDENGKFSYPKFVEMFENHSFRKYWISMATKKIAAVISYFADPYTQKKFTTTFQVFINNFLRGQGVPKEAMFDVARQTESLTALANYYSKKYFGQKVDSKKYIEPTVAYFQDLISLAQEKGLVGTGVDSDELSHKIADTINLEIIEPIVRVNRAYRFALKVPKCDRYVMCLVNQIGPDEVESIPGLKLSLSRAASIVASWFISDHGKTTFWSLYHVVVEENNCQARYIDECHDFHVEEIRVTTEYIHNEL